MVIFMYAYVYNLEGVKMRYFLKFGWSTPSFRRKYVENEIPKILGRKNNNYPPLKIDFDRKMAEKRAKIG